MLKVRIETKNSAFDDDKTEEVTRILKDDVIRMLNNGYDEGRILDLNGNRVGSFKLT